MSKQENAVDFGGHSDFLDYLFYKGGFDEFVQAVVDGHSHSRFKKTSTIYAHYAKELDRALAQAYQQEAGRDPAECKAELLALAEKAKLDESLDAKAERDSRIPGRRM
jgi:hypothetical protein